MRLAKYCQIPNKAMIEIPLHDSSSSAEPVQITQLYTHIELFRSGTPINNALFILSRDNAFSLTNPTLADGALTDSTDDSADQLLIIDPPADAATRFSLSGQVAALFTGPSQQIGLTLMQTQRGGEAHIRIGDHYLDIYSFLESNIVHLPALGILCGGGFGSDALPPALAISSDGGEELDMLRLLARLIKQHRLQLFIPHTGSLQSNELDVMKALADDVAYLHRTRRFVTDLAGQGEKLSTILATGHDLLPTKYADPTAAEIHRRNLQILFTAAATA